VIAIESCSNLGLLRNISKRTKEVEFVWKTEPGPDNRARHNGQSEQPSVEDDRLLDHHIEEILGTLTAAARMRESTSNAEEQPVD
jgi:hypothetical protein